jgi:hypothetical protein
MDRCVEGQTNLTPARDLDSIERTGVSTTEIILANDLEDVPFLTILGNVLETATLGSDLEYAESGVSGSGKEGMTQVNDSGFLLTGHVVSFDDLCSIQVKGSADEC